MKKTYLLFFLACLAVGLRAQITVTNAVFPAAGDSLKTASDFDPQGITITGPGGPFTWNFSNLNADDRQATWFQPAANGVHAADYPAAELVVIDDLFGETYFDVSATAFSVLGISGSGFAAGLPIEASLRYNPALQELHAPLTFPNVFTTTSSLAIAFSTDQIPSEILDSLGVPTGLLDSIRIRYTIDRNDFVDAFGTLSIPGGTYDVLRQKRTDHTDTRIDIHTFLGWQDITDLLGDFGAFGRDTTISYQFISATEKEPIAVVTMDSTGTNPVTVDFKDLGGASATDNPLAMGVEVIVTPNPAIDQVTFRIAEDRPRDLKVQLFDAAGRTGGTGELTGNSLTLRLPSFGTGLYVYRLVDKQGHMVAAGRLSQVR